MIITKNGYLFSSATTEAPPCESNGREKPTNHESEKRERARTDELEERTGGSGRATTAGDHGDTKEEKTERQVVKPEEDEEPPETSAEKETRHISQ